jgi:hypothetical protein
VSIGVVSSVRKFVSHPSLTNRDETLGQLLEHLDGNIHRADWGWRAYWQSRLGCLEALSVAFATVHRRA